ncbi:hypothetical protein [Pseudomonas chlororaphis]|uniref:hypothetical protein n=1 Tax=Pseudomonas chlororaphis TaxID=587753 RepID=UPI0024084B43|nr:hypothetical protein [Pseudomonas chlororaphis]
MDDKTIDFSAVLTNIRSQNPDLIFFGVDPRPRHWPGIKQLGIKAPLMGAGGFVSQTFLQLAQTRA